MANIKALFKNINESDKLKFREAQCLLLISVGQEAHEAERFETIIELINNSFGLCIISLYDSLQRHTMALNSPKGPEAFHEVAAKEGDLWLERNEKYYNNLTIPKKIIRWDVWLNHRDFIAQQEKLRSSAKRDPSYMAAFEQATDFYLDRYCKRLPNPSSFDLDRARSLCFEYLLEECTVLCLWPELECQFEVYPNWHNNAMEETRKRFVRPFYPHLLHAIRLGFRNAKQVKPQHFQLLQNEEESSRG